MNQRYRPDDQRNDPRRRDPSGPETQGDRYGHYGEQRYRTESSWRRDEQDGPPESGARRSLYGQYRSEQAENPGYGQEQYARGFGSGPGRFDRELGDTRGVGHYDVGTYTPEPYYGTVRPDPRDRGDDARQRARSTSHYDRGSGYDTGWYEGGRGSDRFESARGPHYGRGPRNYSRSDERITEDLNERLTDDTYLDASEIEVQVSSGVASLSGTVPDRWMKHRAEDIADACGGVKEVDNQLRVQSSQ